jgi:hypothetical protein
MRQSFLPFSLCHNSAKEEEVWEGQEGTVAQQGKKESRMRLSKLACALKQQEKIQEEQIWGKGREQLSSG